MTGLDENGFVRDDDAAIRSVTGAYVAGPVKVKTARLLAAEEALQTCFGKRESQAAIAEFFAAKAEAAGKR